MMLAFRLVVTRPKSALTRNQYKVIWDFCPATIGLRGIIMSNLLYSPVLVGPCKRQARSNLQMHWVCWAESADGCACDSGTIFQSLCLCSAGPIASYDFLLWNGLYGFSRHFMGNRVQHTTVSRYCLFHLWLVGAPGGLKLPDWWICAWTEQQDTHCLWWLVRGRDCSLSLWHMEAMGFH